MWENKPLNKETNENLIENVNDYIFTVYRGSDNSPELVNFLNVNYTSSHISSIYEKPIVDYFLRDGFWIKMYSSKFPNNTIGVIAGKKVDINKIGKCTEIDFLCVIPEVRNLKLAERLIKRATQESIINLKISCAFFTGHSNIKDSYFCVKKVYNRPIDVRNMINCGILNKSPDVSINTCCVFFEEFDILEGLSCSTNVDYSKIPRHDIIKRDIEYSKEDCFTDYSVLLNGEQVSFFRFYKCDVRNRKLNKSLKNLILYDFSLSEHDPVVFYYHFEVVCKNLWENKICDKVSFYQTFDKMFDDGYTSSKSVLYYYTFNKKMDSLEQSDVQLYPI